MYDNSRVLFDMAMLGVGALGLHEVRAVVLGGERWMFKPMWFDMPLGGHAITETLFQPSARWGRSGGETQSGSALARTKASPPLAAMVKSFISPIRPPSE